MRILFVCSGNTCRSPMAAVMAGEWASKHAPGAGLAFASAGVAAVDGNPASPGAMQAMRELGLDLSSHRATPLTAATVRGADLVLTLTAAHRERVGRIAPGAAHRTFALREYAGGAGDVADPMGGGPEVYRSTAREIGELVGAALRRALAERKERGGLVKQVIAIGADHAAFSLKEEVERLVGELGYEARDFGTTGAEPVDYPDFAWSVATAVARGECARGILLCGTGIGMSIAANKVPGVRAALCQDLYTARLSREHNDANVLTLGARVIGPGLAAEIVRVWLQTDFAGDRHQRRVDKIRAIEEEFSSRAPAQAFSPRPGGPGAAKEGGA